MVYAEQQDKMNVEQIISLPASKSRTGGEIVVGDRCMCGILLLSV